MFTSRGEGEIRGKGGCIMRGGDGVRQEKEEKQSQKKVIKE
jgi:hypothetical protein